VNVVNATQLKEEARLLKKLVKEFKEVCANHELKDPNFNKQCQTAINSKIVEMKQIESEENYLEKTLEKGKKKRALDFIGK
jgi:hypothetical protein